MWIIWITFVVTIVALMIVELQHVGKMKSAGGLV
jgi:hypothetical protein